MEDTTRKPTAAESVAIIEDVSGRQFFNRDLIGFALKAANFNGTTGYHSEGNRDAARSAIMYLNQCVNMRCTVKYSDEWHHAQNVYIRFNRRDDLIHIAEATGIEACIAHSERQESASPKVKAFAVRALIWAVYHDSGGDLEAVCDALDRLALYLPDQSQSQSQSPNLSEEPRSQSQSQSPPLLQASSESSDPSAALSWSTSNETSMSTPATSTKDSTLGDSTGISSPSPPSSSTRLDTSGSSHSGLDDADPSSDIEMLDVSTQSVETAVVERGQRVQPLSSGKATAIFDLEAYVRRQREKALQIGVPQAQSRLPLGFLEIFSASPTSFRDPDVVLKLYLSPLSPYTTSSVRRAIMSIRSSNHSLTRAPTDTDSRIQSHYEAIKRANENSAASSILVRYHSHRLYITTRDRRDVDFDGGFVNETSASYLANSKRGSGNPITKQRSEADAALFRKLEPDFDSKPEVEQSHLKTQIKACIRLGQRLDKLVTLVGSRGILCLLPFSTMDTTQPHCLSIGRENLNTIKDNEFKAVVGAWTRDIDHIRRFSTASEPILDILVNEPDRPRYGRFQMENTDGGVIEGMVHGSEDLLYQFTRIM